VISDQVPKRTSPLSEMLFYRLDEAYCEVGDEDTAFGGQRTPGYTVFLIGDCPTPELLSVDRAWVRDSCQALLPHSEDTGSYLNGMTEYVEDRVLAAYGAKYPRLAQIKARYDPENMFHRNPNIKPG
jgi:hypothetical protein